MKKIILFMLVISVSLVTAQKRATKKDADKNNQNYTTKFMVIKGVEVDLNQEGLSKEELESVDISLEMKMKKKVKSKSKFLFSFDVGRFDKEVELLLEESTRFRSMAQAVTKAMEFGWYFVDANVVYDGDIIIHYYYMMRK